MENSSNLQPNSVLYETRNQPQISGKQTTIPDGKQPSAACFAEN